MSPIRAAWPILISLLLVSPSVAQAQVLASGTFDLQFSLGPGSPSFNSPLTRMHTMPADLEETAGGTLIVSLVDLSQPGQLCDPDDPFGGLLDGCATVDWPFPGRRGINLVEVQLSTGLETFHLRMSDQLAADPEPDGP